MSLSEHSGLDRGSGRSVCAPIGFLVERFSDTLTVKLVAEVVGR